MWESIRSDSERSFSFVAIAGVQPMLCWIDVRLARTSMRMFSSMMNQFLMEWYKVERMQALEEALDTRFGNHFRGSKAQRKNAEKELQKLHAEADAEKAAKKAARVRSLEDDIRAFEFILNNDYEGCWWEIPGLPAPYKVHRTLEELKKELAELLS